MNEVILSVKGLNTVYKTGKRNTRALRDLNIDIYRGETISLVGESGSGKSTLGLSIMRLIEEPNIIEVDEEKGAGIYFYEHGNETSIMELSLPKIREFRWKKIAMIFQSAMNVLNPVMRIEAQFIETFEAHKIEGNFGERINHYLEIAGLSKNVRRLYPHELSGGMKQRVCIALALSCEPDLLIADEPTTALDAVVQKEILLELTRLKEELHLTIVFITHDLRVAASVSDRIGIFYGGRVVELGTKEDILNNPAHPYTNLLLSSIVTMKTPKDADLATLSGTPPDLSMDIPGCSFLERCPIAEAGCRTYDLDPVHLNKGHFAECIKAKSKKTVGKGGVLREVS